MRNLLFLITIGLALIPATLTAQLTSLPPSGWNQKASVSQHIGLVTVTIEYSSPDVTGDDGKSRDGHIWGELVPYGLADNDFGTASKMPWRAGANENTVFTVSHDVTIAGKALAAGRYGLHMIPAEKGPWTLIFSKNADAWGSYFYDPAHDALRVEVQAIESPYQEWLTFFFEERKPTSAVAVMAWERLRVPFTIEVPRLMDYYVAQIEKELQGTAGFGPEGWVQAAQFTLQHRTHLEKGLEWAENAVSRKWVGIKNFSTLSTKAQVLMALGRNEEAETVMNEAIRQPDASVTQIHQFGRQLLSTGKTAKAIEVFEYNAQKFPGEWPVYVGLTRAYAAAGDLKKALKYAKLALPTVPAGDELNRNSIQDMIRKLEKGENI